MSEKDELLSLHDDEQKHETNLSFKTLLISLLTFAIVLCFFLPKIYIANQIYYISREITEISNQRDTLLEENRALKSQLENLKYSITILNPLSQ
ncbi:MAG: hypothetical protein K5978_03140 [Campylobacter sp.]|nr:hypothetical protein [Campylobacter sp.]